MLRAACVLVAFLFSTDATPSCNFVGNQQRDIHCAPGNTDFVLRRGLVSENDKVTGITLRDCRITEVDYEAFHLLPALEYLDLSRNKIKTFKLGVLDGFNGLKFMNLSYNEITDLPLGLLDSKYNLELLDLKGNRLTNIHVGTLYPLKKLKHLDISSNDYLGRHLIPAIFSFSPLIGFMDFSRTDMSGSKDNLLEAFTAINFLNLDRCSLPEVPNFAIQRNLKTMKMLFLSSNRLTGLTDAKVFKNLEQLEVLNLIGNMIDVIVNGVFSPLKQIKSIMLSDNRLKHLPESLFRSLPILRDVDLSRNLLENLPVSAFGQTGLKNLIVSHNRLTFLQNNFFLELRNHGVVLDKFHFDENPWQCACLRDVLNEVKFYEIDYNAERYDGNHAVCATTIDFNCKHQETENSVYASYFYSAV